MPKAVKGVLVQCDPSIKAIILKIDQDKHDYIVEDLDDQTLMVKETQLPKLKARLEEELANTQQMPDDSGSD
ncbi:MAG: RNA polymerase II transcription factor B subunit 5 [Lasallia pustulata]|uniref:General transcription and DNA repair factor IIH subunit TFB5 n=1 Tax=Lasallia pustulata TaxID=136370 RepID=A0A5M8Q0X4_9LECA|nr:MAG: RNA polymerase II transcription factor B subunit 5 [Lasallia pustulata]